MFDLISKHLEVRQKTTLPVVFSTLFSVFGDVIKHGLSCFIYYLYNLHELNKCFDTAKIAIIGIDICCFWLMFS